MSRTYMKFFMLSFEEKHPPAQTRCSEEYRNSSWGQVGEMSLEAFTSCPSSLVSCLERRTNKTKTLTQLLTSSPITSIAT